MKKLLSDLFIPFAFLLVAATAFAFWFYGPIYANKASFSLANRGLCHRQHICMTEKGNLSYDPPSE